MSLSQQLFAVFYAVLFGAMLSSLKGFVPFPWGQVLRIPHTRSKRLLWLRYVLRLLVSIIVLNALPLLLFGGIFRLLANSSEICSNQLTLGRLLLIGGSALGVYAPYRLFHFLVIITGRSSKRCLRYTKRQIQALNSDRKMGLDPFAHLVSGLIYCTVSLALAYSLTPGEAQWVAIVVGLLLAIALMLLADIFRRWRKSASDG